MGASERRGREADMRKIRTGMDRISRIKEKE
jgi:hypothetical protein